jgi:hypothetical protein
MITLLQLGNQRNLMTPTLPILQEESYRNSFSIQLKQDEYKSKGYIRWSPQRETIT